MPSFDILKVGELPPVPKYIVMYNCVEMYLNQNGKDVKHSTGIVYSGDCFERADKVFETFSPKNDFESVVLVDVDTGAQKVKVTPHVKVYLPSR